MQGEDRDAARIWDMLDSARVVSELVAGKILLGYENDRPLRLATERALEIIGEAARHVSVAFQQAHPEIPWSRMIGFRNLLAHEYGEILADKVWEIATRAVPELIAHLEPLLPLPPDGD